MKLNLYFLLFLSLLFVGCQTNMVREFESLKVGFDKHQVLDKLGSPRNITRMNSEDRWYYMIYSNDQRLFKEVHFKDGLVIYFGDKKTPAPELLPESIDAKNQKVNEDSLIDQEKKSQASKNAYMDYLKYERKIKKQDQIEYLPDFEPVQ